MKRLVFLLAVAFVSIVPARAQQQGDDKGSTDHAFQPGGKIWMNLSAGDYDIRPASDARIVVRWEGRKSGNAPLRAAIRTEGATAWVETADAKNHDKVTIEVPARSDLHVRMSAGDLRIEGIEGNKDVSLWAGDLNIDVGKTSDYGKLDASVRVGDLDARPFSVSKGGIMRSFTWTGTGRYTLSASLFAGDLTLFSGSRP